MSELQVGREMDAAVARTLGWYAKARYDEDVWCSPDGKSERASLMFYSTSDADALMALREKREQRPDLSVMLARDWYQPGWEVTIGLVEDNCAPDKYIKGFGETITLAICHALLCLHKREAG